jgi:hypothetical protein
MSHIEFRSAPAIKEWLLLAFIFLGFVGFWAALIAWLLGFFG